MEQVYGLDKAIRWHRRSLRMSQTELGKICGVECCSVSRWEKGIMQPSIANLIKMAKFFGVSEQELLYPSDARILKCMSKDKQ